MDLAWDARPGRNSPMAKAGFIARARRSCRMAAFRIARKARCSRAAGTPRVRHPGGSKRHIVRARGPACDDRIHEPGQMPRPGDLRRTGAELLARAELPEGICAAGVRCQRNGHGGLAHLRQELSSRARAARAAGAAHFDRRVARTAIRRRATRGAGRSVSRPANLAALGLGAASWVACRRGRRRRISRTVLRASLSSRAIALIFRP